MVSIDRVGRPESAFTLAEMLLAMGLLTLMFLTVAMLFAQLLKHSAKSSNLAVGTVYAERVMEQALAIGVDALPPRFGASEGIYSVDEASQTQFFYRVEVGRVLTATVVPSYVIRVPVWWWSTAPNQARQGSGKQSVTLQRFHTPGSTSP